MDATDENKTPLNFVTVDNLESSPSNTTAPCSSARDLFGSCSNNVNVIGASSDEEEPHPKTLPFGEAKQVNKSESKEKIEEKEGPARAKMQFSNFSATSTPLLPTRRLPPPTVDVSAIREDDDQEEWLDLDSSSSISPIKPKVKGKKKPIIYSDESGDDELELNKENNAASRQLFGRTPATPTATSSGTGTMPDDFQNLSQQIEELQLEEPKVKKRDQQFKFKVPSVQPQQKEKPVVASSSASGTITVDVLSDEDDNYHSVLGVSDDDDDNPIIVDEVAPAITSKTKLERNRLLDLKKLEERHLQYERENKPNFHDIHARRIDPKAPTADAPANLMALAFRKDVQKSIQYLADTLGSIPSDDSRAERPPGLKVDLYDHQSYGLEWLHWREGQYPGGGILADEMGLGKTIMMIALILRGKLEGMSHVNKPWTCPSTARSRLVQSKSTLIIVPPSVLAQWESEISTKSSKLRLNVYHGTKRTASPAVLAQYDIVLSSYQTIGSEMGDGKRDRPSPLERVYWQRIILDEGHIIRNSKTHAAKAVYKLEAAHRWVVTGTPVHNRPSDMQSLIKFLRLKPFDEPEVWDYWIGMKAVKAANMPRLNTIGNALILRRTKEEVKNDGGKVQNIPPKYVTDVKIKMGEDHRNVYQYFKEFAESKFKVFLEEKEDAAKQQAAANYVAGRNKLKNQKQDTEIVSFSTILVLMLRMRQVSVLPFLTSKMLGEDDEDLSGEFDPLDDEDVISHRNPVFAETFISAKLAQLFEDLEEIKNKCLSENRPMDKVIIVSQWTTLLKIVHSHLRYRGYSLATVSGEIKFEDRAETVRRFNSESKRPQIMLLSLAAGGVGLNLVGGNHMIFLDIHYNPQLELQAQDRIHRFGQTKDVHIRRYVCEDSMEERVVALQATKLELSNGLLSSSNKKGAAGVGLSLQDIRKLFDM